MAYAITYQTPRRAKRAEPFSYDQQTFYATRIERVNGVVLHSRELVTDGNNVQVAWYDSSFATLKPVSGMYATLFMGWGSARR
jgi:hypothetical protein